MQKKSLSALGSYTFEISQNPTISIHSTKYMVPIISQQTSYTINITNSILTKYEAFSLKKTKNQAPKLKQIDHRFRF